MTDRILFLYDNKSLMPGVTVAVSSQASSFLAGTNLLDPDPGVPWRALDCDNESILLTWPVATDMRYLALINHNLSLGAQIMVEIAEVYDNSITLTLGPFAAWRGAYGLGEGRLGVDPLGGYPSAEERAAIQGIAFIDLGQTVGAKQVRITIVDPENPAGYVQVGVVMADPGFTPAINMSFNWVVRRIDPSTQINLEGGGRRAVRRASWRMLEIPFDFLDETDAIQFFGDMERIAGLSRHLLAMPFPGAGTVVEQRTLLYGMLADLKGVQNWNYGVYRTAVAIQEVRG
jgi:hypothetical protein